MNIRLIEQRDNQIVARLIRETLISFGAEGEGFASEDPEVDSMFEHFSTQNGEFYVIEDEDKVLGCGGFAPLKGSNDTCELQKMYFFPELRGRGMGRALIELILDKAKDYGFSRCYLETLPHMDRARQLYEKQGFTYLDAREGDTGHSKCNVWMIRSL